MKFSEYLWQSIAPIYQQVLQHPFNVELMEGTLDRERFIFYLRQDAYYLISFSRALAFIAGKATSSKIVHQFLNFSIGALIAERELHSSFLGKHDDGFEPSLSCIAYTHYLISIAASASIEEAIAAVLPCFWIYKEVGRYASEHSTQANPYIKWIETYSCQKFSDATTQAISLLDEMATGCSREALERMRMAFEYSALFEWHFWNDAYKMMSFKESIFKTLIATL